MKRFLHFILGCPEKLLGWTVMGNPVFQCPDCGRIWVVYGSDHPVEHDLTAKQAQDLIAETQEG